MSNFGVMVAEIRQEIRRSGMDDAIKRGIGAAVLFHRDKRFKWNEASFSFSTAANQEDYGTADNASIGRLAVIDVVKIASPETKLTARTIDYLRSLVRQSTGCPLDYAYYEAEVFFSPVPNTIYTVNVDGVIELADTNQVAANQIISKDNILTIPDSYSTEWFGAGYEIIKAWAKGYINLHHLRNQAESTAMFSAAGDLRTDQEGQLAMLGGSGFVRPTKF